MFTFAFTSLILAGLSLASPARRTSTGCSAFPTNGVANVANFTLSAIHPNGNVDPLAIVPDTPSLLNSFIAVSQPKTKLTMVNSGISTGVQFGPASLPVDDSNALIEFVSHTSFSPAQDYCELVNTSPNDSPYPDPVLAVNGDSEKFYICDNASTSSAVAKKLLVYNPQNDGTATRFVASTCKPVHVLVHNL